jgi:hypothetical protein
MSDKSHHAVLNTATSPKPTPVKLTDHEMHCPCCGAVKLIEVKNCEACGARPIAEGMARPITRLPKLGPSMTALGLVVFIVVGFVMLWLMVSDMKVARALLVHALGDGFEFTKRFLIGDDHLLRYRIFTWDVYHNAFNVCLIAMPLALIAMRKAWVAARNAKHMPLQFGGLRTAQLSFALASFLFVGFAAAGLGGIPNMIERGRERHLAATRAAMYEQAAALQAFNRENGTYPQERTELSNAKQTRTDYWENEFNYEPFGTVASNATGVISGIGFNSYTLRSAGPDGALGTADDIVMIDGVIVSRPAEADLPPSLLVPATTRK